MPAIKPPPYEVDVDAFGEGARELIDNFRRLGLLWEIRFAVIGGSTFYNEDITKVPVKIDGDENYTFATSFIGNSISGERVAVMCVPPNHVYIVGRLKKYSSQSAMFRRASTQSIPSGADTKVAFTSSDYTMPSYISVNGTGEDFTVLQNGQYGISATVRWVGRAAGNDRYAAIVDSTNVVGLRYGEQEAIKMTHAGGVSLNVTAQQWFQAGDSFSVTVFQDSGTPLNLDSVWGNPRLGIAYLDLR